MTVVALLLGGLLLAMVGLTVFDALFRSSFRRLAVRNIARRPGEAVLVVAGSMLGTAIITAAFIVGDTFDASIRDFARTELGPVDEAITTQDTARVDDIVTSLTTPPVPGTDGVLAMRWSDVAIAVSRSERAGDVLAEPQVRVGEVDFDAAREFGADVGSTGFAALGATPTGDEIVIGGFAADQLGIEVGDTVEVHGYGTSRSFAVRAIAPRVGLAGYADALVPVGTLAGMAATDTGGAQPPWSQVFVSNDGGVYSGVEGTGAVMREIESRLALDPAVLAAVDIDPVKQDLLDDAREQGEGIGSLFTTIGAFSVLVGILLLVNLFVMLAEERTTELGLLRAVGLKRNHLLRVFTLEGAMYSAVACLAGGVVGIGVGWAIVQVTKTILGADDADLNFVFTADPSSLASGVLIGFVIALATVWLTSIRIARRNVIRALRELPDPDCDRLTLGRAVLSVSGIALGTLLTVAGLGQHVALATIAGPPLVLLAAIPLLRRLVGRRAANVALGALALGWGAFAFTLAPAATADADVDAFVVQGVVLVSSAVIVVSSADGLWSRLADWLSNRGTGVSTRLALAYPLARQVRTGIQLAMFALIVFTMTFMSVFIGIFRSQAPAMALEAGGGAEVLVDSAPGNPATAESLRAVDGVADAAPLLRGLPEFTTSWERDPTQWPMSGFDERLLDLGTPELSSRDTRFADDRAVYAAVLRDPSLAIVPDFFLQDEGGPPENQLEIGDRFTVVSPVSQRERELTVAGVISDDWILNGAMVSWDVADAALEGQAVANRHYVRTVDGVDPEAVADRLAVELLPNGADARTFRAEIEGELAEQNGFFRLMQGYLGLGLAIGIAGLGVVLVRAVRERRRQIGMLRAMGFRSGVVRRAFLLEATFVAAQGIALGIGLGLLTSYNVLTHSTAFGDEPLPFTVPWLGLAFLFFVPLLAALATAVTPANRAARIRPAVALRMTD
jgi:putative ABC transport system permease protein